MIEDLGEGEKGQHEDRDVFCTHEGLSKAHRSSRCNAQKVCTVELVSLQRRPLRDCVNFTNFVFWIKYHFNVGI